MGLMDRDYYREKTGANRKESLIEKLKRNPIAVIVLIAILILLLGILF
jgi:hypothetical protein